MAACLTFTAGCAMEADLGEVSSASTVTNGQNLNGQNLNGQNLNGQNLNGQNLNGQNLNGQNLNGPDSGTFTIWTSLEGVKLGGMVLDSTRLSATVFTGTKGSSVRTGRDLIGADLTAMRGDGRAVPLRLRDIVSPPAGSTIWRYLVDYREDDGAWYPLCNGSAAIPLEGIWDHRQGVTGGGAHISDPTKFTFACEGRGALGKCVSMGYEPWSSSDGVLLAKHHQACVRLLRGDYCGDGTPYTTDGSWVNVYDALGVQVDTEDWVFEAEWDASGARCFSKANRSKSNLPCYNARLKTECGSLARFTTGTLLMDETPTDGAL
jgi:hypothetical protein